MASELSTANAAIKDCYMINEEKLSAQTFDKRNRQMNLT